MNANPLLGVILHALGGFAAGSFYIPFKKVKGWAWESYWLVGGFFSWIIAPWVVGLLLIRTRPFPSLPVPLPDGLRRTLNKYDAQRRAGPEIRCLSASGRAGLLRGVRQHAAGPST